MLTKLKSLRERFHYDDNEMPFLEHLEAFRNMAIRLFVALILGMAVCLPFADQLIGFLRAPAEPYIEQNAAEALQSSEVSLRIPASSLSDTAAVVGEDGERYFNVQANVDVSVPEKQQHGVIRLQFSEPSAAIKMWLTVSFFGGLLLSLPAVIFIIGLFVMPGVRNLERKLMGRIAFFSGGLFLLGISMGYKITLPLALGLMLKIGGALGGESIWFYNKYIAFALQLLLGFGLAFQLPVVILIMGKMGLVNSTQLHEKRRHVIVGLLILAMLLTPPDVMTQLLMAAPLILLYEFCIWFLHFSGNRAVPVLAEEEPDSSTADDHLETVPEKSDVANDDEQTKNLSED